MKGGSGPSRRPVLHRGPSLARDAIMRECDRLRPGYGLARNMGCASEGHRDALRRLGPSAIQRRSFQGTQPWLF